MLFRSILQVRNFQQKWPKLYVSFYWFEFSNFPLGGGREQKERFWAKFRIAPWNNWIDLPRPQIKWPYFLRGVQIWQPPTQNFNVKIILLVNVTHQKSIDRNDPSSDGNDSLPAEEIIRNSSQVTSNNEVSAINSNILKRLFTSGKVHNEPKGSRSQKSGTSKDQKRYKPGYWLPESEEAETFNYSVVPVQDFTYYYFY